MSILLAAFYYRGYGIGHLVRMINLYNYLQSHTDAIIRFTTNDPIILKKISSVQCAGRNTDVYDVVLVDSPFNFDLTFNPGLRKTIVKKYRSRAKYLIGFDVADYLDNQYDAIVNLFNHNQKDLGRFKGKILSGVDYAILNEEILTARKKLKINTIPNILITFGGEDPNSNLLKTLKRIDVGLFKITVVLGGAHNQRESLGAVKAGINVIEHTKAMGSLLSLNDIIICGGGTTLIEALFIGNPVIAVPQNKFENDFIAKIKSAVPIFSLNDIEELGNQTRDRQFRGVIKKKYNELVDGKGKERILKLIQSLH